MASSTMENISRDNHSHSSRPDDLVFVLSVCLVAIEILGLLCNGIILTVYYKYSRLRTATNLFILNLAVCNLLLAILQLLLSTPSYFNGEWLYGDNACIAYGFTHQYLMTVAVTTLAVIAFDRFCVITKPVRKLQTFIITKPRARLLILTTHIYSFVFTFPLLVGWNKLMPDKRFNTGCYIHYSNRSASPMAYTITSTVFTCVLPLLITSCCYAKIYKSVRKSSRRTTLYKRKRQSVVKDTGVRKKSLYHTRTARMIAIVMFFFLLTWLPTKVTGLFVTFGCSVPALAVYVSVFLAKACVMYNAVVYVFLNHRFRAAFLHLTFPCREDSRMRFTTSATNASVRAGDIQASIVESTDKLRVLSRKNLSRLSFTPEADIPEISSTSGRVSTLDLKRTSKELSVCEDLSACRHDSSEGGRDSSEVVRKESEQSDSLAVGSEALCKESKQFDTLVNGSVVWSKNKSCLNKGVKNEACEDIKRREDKIRQHLPTVGGYTPMTNNGLPHTERVTSKFEASSTGKNQSGMNYGFNNLGFFYQGEKSPVKNSDKSIEKHLELDINALGDMI